MKAIKLLIKNPFLFLKKVYQRILRAYKHYVIKDEFTIEVARWFKDRGDETLRLDYPELNESSVVFDLGGYVGDFAQAINEKYGCKVYLFEPHPQFYEVCKQRFADNDKVIPLNYGLSDEDGEFLLSDSVDGSSFLNPNHAGKGSFSCKIKEVLGVLDELGIKTIDLMKINIEGGEYPLLTHLAHKNRLALVSEYQIQFHDFIPQAISIRNNIIEALSQTHQRTWCYVFVWENWKKM